MRKVIVSTLFSLFMVPGLAAAADKCEAVIEGNDAMQFNINEMTVPKSCETYKVTLKHVGKLPVTAMGHNWVLTKEEDMQDVATDAVQAGLDNDYIKPDDDRVIAHTDMIGGGEETSVEVDVSKLSADENYTYFCSFPGHWAVMKGTLKLES